MSIYAVKDEGVIGITDMVLQFSSARQSELFEMFQTHGNFFFYLALSFALIGGLVLLFRPSLWRIQPVVVYLFILFIMAVSSINSDSLFFDEVSFNEGSEEKIFTPQAVVLNVSDKVKNKLSDIFNGAPSGQYVQTLSQIEHLRIDNLKRKLEMSYYKEICSPVGGDETAEYVGTSTHLLAQTDGGRIFADKMASSYFNLKHVYKLNDYYYKQAEINPLILNAVTPVYGTMITNSQSSKEIAKRLDKRMRKYISDDDIELLGWDKKNTWQQEAEGIVESIEQVENILKLPKLLPIPPFMLNNPLVGANNNEVIFRSSIAPYITPYGFKKQMEYPVVIEFKEDDVVLNCLDFHERTVQKISEDFVNTEFYNSDNFTDFVNNFKNMLPPNMQENARSILVEGIILPHLGRNMYQLNSFPKASFSEKLSQIFPYVQSLLLGIFLFITPLLLLIGLLLPFWGTGIILMLVLGVAWLELWQIFLTVGSGVYNHIAPFMLADITIESLVSVYVYGISIVHGAVSVFAILILPSLVKSLPFKVAGKPAFSFKAKQNIINPQLEGILQKFKDSLPDRIKEHIVPSAQNQQPKPMGISTEHMSKTTVEKIKDNKRVEPHVTAMESKHSQNINQQKQSTLNVQKSPEVAINDRTGRGSSVSGSSGNAYGMFQKVVQENYMTLGYDPVNALQMTEKHMQHMTDDDMRTGNDDGKSYVEVRESSLKENVSGGEKSSDGYVRFYQKKG